MALVFGKSFQRPEANFLHWRITKIAPIAEFTTSKFFSFKDLIHFPGLNLSLKEVKHTILSLQKQLIFHKYFSIYTHLLEVGKSSKTDAYIKYKLLLKAQNCVLYFF